MLVSVHQSTKMNLSKYFFNLIQTSDGLSPEEIKNSIKTQPGKTFQVVANGFAPTFLSSLLFWPNVEIFFSTEDNFSLESEKTFINGLQEEDRKRVNFLSKGFQATDIEALLKLQTSFVIWDQPGSLQRPSDLIKWANMAKGQVRLVANSYNALVLKHCLNSALCEVFRKEEFDISTIQDLADKGKEKAIVIADGFSQSAIDDFKSRGARVWIRGVTLLDNEDDDPFA